MIMSHWLYRRKCRRSSSSSSSSSSSVPRCHVTWP